MDLIDRPILDKCMQISIRERAVNLQPELKRGASLDCDSCRI